MANNRRGKQIAVVTGANLADGAPGGTRSYVTGLIRYLLAHGVGVAVLSNGPAETIPEACEVFRVTPEFVGSSLAFRKRLGRWARKNDLSKFGILHFQRPDDIWALRSLKPLPPAICTLHGNIRRSIRRNWGVLPAVAYTYVESHSLNRFREIIAVDENTARGYRRQYPELAPRIHTISVAVDERELHSGDRMAPNPDPTRPQRFLYIGRLSAEKRVHLIIDAIKAFSPPEPHLVVAGSGPEESSLRKRARGSPVSFVGAVNRHDLARLFNEADALVIASEYEGLPTVALEAMSFGCPVVALPAEWCSTLAGEPGFIIAAGERGLPAALATAVDLRPLRSTFALPQRFTWPVVGGAILDTYRRVSPEVGIHSAG